MDPYLENPALWPEVHNRLILYLGDQLQPLLRPRYVAAVEARVYVEAPERRIVPDVHVHEIIRTSSQRELSTAVLEVDTPVEVEVPELEINETHLQILDLESGDRVVAVVELVSPTNKYAGPGRDLYVSKQQQVRASQAHLIEIDLLRTGPHVLAVPEHFSRANGQYDYLVCVNRAIGKRDRFQLYGRPLRERLPRIRIPLAEGDADVALDLQAALEEVYVRGAYDARLNYRRPCRPPLSPEDQAWADELIRTRIGASPPNGESAK
jgi:hypothetical protein